jgi:hypothetical protein
MRVGHYDLHHLDLIHEIFDHYGHPTDFRLMIDLELVDFRLVIDLELVDFRLELLDLLLVLDLLSRNRLDHLHLVPGVVAHLNDVALLVLDVIPARLQLLRV